MSNTSAFLPEDYDIPVDQKYFKLQQGDNRFRILGHPVIGWLDWTADKKPVRFRMDDKPEASIDPAKPVRHFWAFVVWNYELNRLQVAEIVQKSIQYAIKKLSSDADWGNPSEYDIKICREGEGRETEYTVTPVAPKPLADDIKAIYAQANINLDALFSDGDPFKVEVA